MSVSGEEPLQPGSDSFWEVEGYRRTVKRVEDGAAQCNELMKFLQERAEIEKEYAKRLKAWAKKWNDNFDKGPEYGTNKATLKGSLNEAEHVADIHLAVKDRLINDVQTQIKDWKNEHYKKQMVGGCKEAKNFEEEFRKAQKPWGKRLAKLLKAKKEFHLACKLEKTATNQENNARNSSDVSAEQLKKLQEKLEKCHKDVDSTRERYQQSLSELNSYNAKYVEDMTEVFQRTQEFELGRLNFFKKVLYDLHSCLDLTQNKTLPEIYSQLHSTVDQLDANYDLKLWSQLHGVDMAMAWPTFEEYSTDFHSISTRDTARNNVALDNNVRLTALQRCDPVVTTTTTGGGGVYNSAQNASGYSATASTMSISSSQNPFGDDEWDSMYTNATEMKDPPRTASDGVPVRALFDYVGQEEDELSFLTGDIFLKIKDRDDQGWCTGRKDGRVGLYPDNYVERV